MAHLYKEEKEVRYKDLLFQGTEDEHRLKLQQSTTLYIGNLSFYTTEEQLWELFSKCGAVKRIIMGLNKKTKTPCGFCFVEFYSRKDAENGVRYISGTKLDDRTIRADWDTGFVEGRQYGRGSSGGQVRDEYRVDYDPGRGGYGGQKMRDFLSGATDDPKYHTEDKKREREEEEDRQDREHDKQRRTTTEETDS